MLIVLYPTYKISVEIKDRPIPPTADHYGEGKNYKPHKFFDSFAGRSGCDEALAAVKEALGWRAASTLSADHRSRAEHG